MSDVMELTRGERAHLVARTTAEKLGLKGPVVMPQPMARLMAEPNVLLGSGPTDIAKIALARAFAVERVTRIELA